MIIMMMRYHDDSGDDIGWYIIMNDQCLHHHNTLDGIAAQSYYSVLLNTALEWIYGLWDVSSLKYISELHSFQVTLCMLLSVMKEMKVKFMLITIIDTLIDLLIYWWDHIIIYIIIDRYKYHTLTHFYVIFHQLNYVYIHL